MSNLEKFRDGWHLDKRVPITLILALVVQLVTFTWWMSSLSSDIESNADSIARHEIQIQLMREANSTQAMTLGRIEEQIVALRRDLEFTVERILDGQ